MKESNIIASTPDRHNREEIKFKAQSRIEASRGAGDRAIARRRQKNKAARQSRKRNR